MLRHIIAAATLLATANTAAFAHVTLETREAPIGGGYKAVLRVPHGCKGSATIKIRVQIPEGVISVKPMPKPGWTLETVKGTYAKAYPYYHGTTLAEGVKEVAWSGGKLPDDHYDEFILTRLSHHGSQARHHALFPRGAGMRAGRGALDRDTGGGQIGGRL